MTASNPYRSGNFNPYHRKNLARRAALDMAASRTPAELDRIAELRREPCPTDPRFTHLIPPSLARCARPGCAATALDQENAA
ncbi:hypothetical protein ACFPZL_01095 [Leucobacter soli]|uniref:Uncharacterized protein n=1 Tax=Leucobacter soli TaxID=2812850 RepID=A0A916K1S8_9MICO|nr:hypothetical protein [Leucobacter soli]CAG7618313.1 hypothetical protein LEUCIP111803_02192 [Leucobacter soli]